MKTISVTFAKKFTPGFDVAYTYKTAAEDVQEGQIMYVITADNQIKKVQVVTVHKEYDYKAEERFGSLAEAFAEPPVVEEKKEVHRL